MIPLKKLFKSSSPASTTWIQRGNDRRKQDLGWKVERRKLADRRYGVSEPKSYEYVGLSQGGWTEVKD